MQLKRQLIAMVFLGVTSSSVCTAFQANEQDIDKFLNHPSIRQMRVLQNNRETCASIAAQRLKNVDPSGNPVERDSLLRLNVALGSDVSLVESWPDEFRQNPKVRFLIKFASALRATDDSEQVQKFLTDLGDTELLSSLMEENTALFGERAERLFNSIVTESGGPALQMKTGEVEFFLVARVFKRDFGRLAEEAIQDRVNLLIHEAVNQTDIDRRKHLFDSALRLLQEAPSRTYEILKQAAEQMDWNWERRNFFPSLILFHGCIQESRQFSWKGWQPVIAPFLIDPRDVAPAPEPEIAWECNRHRLLGLGRLTFGAQRAGNHHKAWVRDFYLEHWKSMLMNDVPEAVAAHIQSLRISDFRTELLRKILESNQIDVLVFGLNLIPEISTTDEWQSVQPPSGTSMRDPEVLSKVKTLFRRSHNPHETPRLPESLRQASTRAMVHVEPGQFGGAAVAWLPYLSSENAPMRREGVLALRSIRSLPPWSVECLAGLLDQDTDVQVRIAVLEVLNESWELNPEPLIQSQRLGFALLANAVHPETVISDTSQRLLDQYVQTSPWVNKLVEKGLQDANQKIKELSRKLLNDHLSNTSRLFCNAVLEALENESMDCIAPRTRFLIAAEPLNVICKIIFFELPIGATESDIDNQIQLFLEATSQFEWAISRIVELKHRATIPEHLKLLDDCLARLAKATQKLKTN